MDDWFLFHTRARFRVSPGPGWPWAPRPPGDVPEDQPTPGWPTPEYTAMKEALGAALLRDAPTLNYEQPGQGPRSLKVRSVTAEVPFGPDDTGTALTVGSVAFETACFNPEEGAGPGTRLGEWLSWVEFSYGGGSAGVQLQSLSLVSARAVDADAGLSMCAMTGSALYVRSEAVANG